MTKRKESGLLQPGRRPDPDREQTPSIYVRPAPRGVRLGQELAAPAFVLAAEAVAAAVFRPTHGPCVG